LVSLAGATKAGKRCHHRARFDHLRRRLFRWFFEPSLVQIEDLGEREAEAALLWDATAPLAEMMLERLRGGSS
jgi:hypothetical protein